MCLAADLYMRGSNLPGFKKSTRMSSSLESLCHFMWSFSPIMELEGFTRRKHFRSINQYLQKNKIIMFCKGSHNMYIICMRFNNKLYNLFISPSVVHSTEMMQVDFLLNSPISPPPPPSAPPPHQPPPPPSPDDT